MRIAIMQPYFIPYAGYFRLFNTTDLFVIYDDVQFPKHGWVHRNQLRGFDDKPKWLTLPLMREPLDTKISNKHYMPNHEKIWEERLRAFPIFQFKNMELIKLISRMNDSPVLYITKILEACTAMLDLPFNVIYSSELNVPPSANAEARVIDIVKRLGGHTYVNLSGGVGLYNEQEFEKHGIKLQFLQKYNGSYESILPRILFENREELQKEIYENSYFIREYERQYA